MLLDNYIKISYSSILNFEIYTILLNKKCIHNKFEM